MLSRSFGDYNYKYCISIEPDIYEFKVEKNEKYLILGTDGFWKVCLFILFFKYYS